MEVGGEGDYMEVGGEGDYIPIATWPGTCIQYTRLQ